MLILAVNANAQQFVCTNITFANDYPANRIENDKRKALGTTMIVTFYDNDVRVEEKGVSNSSLILRKVEDGKYQYDEKKSSLVMVVESFLGYVRSLKFYVYKDNKWLSTITTKRK